MRCCGGSLPSDVVAPFPGACEPGPYESITIGAVGDILPHDKVQRAAYAEGSFAQLFEDTIPVMKKANILYGNLECNVAGPLTWSGEDLTSSLGDKAVYDGRAYSGYPHFNAHTMLLKDLAAIPFHVLSTANNHALDRKAEGVDRTIENLRLFGLKHTGTVHSQDSTPEWYSIVDAKGKTSTGGESDWRVAFLSCTFSTNGLTNGKDQVLHCYEGGQAHPKVLNLIRELKERPDVDAVVLVPHWGDVEKKIEVNSKERRAARAFVQAGADMIMATHVHVPQACENVDDHLVCYSSGNFLSKYSSFPARISMFFLGELRRPLGGGPVRNAGFQWHPFEQRSASQLTEVRSSSWDWLRKTFGEERLLERDEEPNPAQFDESKC